MKPLKGHHTVYEDEHPNLYAALVAELSPKRRARLLVYYAELGRLYSFRTSSLASDREPAISPTKPCLPEGPQEKPLGEEYVTGVLREYLQLDADGSA
jgi:hypothetical protein